MHAIPDLGPPANSLDFPKAQIARGRRGVVRCYDGKIYRELEDVLYRDFANKGDARPTQAYWPHPRRPKIKTKLGHIEICVLLKRHYHNGSDKSDVVFQFTSHFVAVKVSYVRRMKGRHYSENPINEISAMQMVGNGQQHVGSIIEALRDEHRTVNTVMPYYSGGDMFGLVHSFQVVRGHPRMPESTARYWFHKVILGIRQLHSFGIYHRDISPENIVIDNNSCRIIDMGMCLRMPYHNSRRQLLTPQGRAGKLPYMPPEIFHNEDSFDGAAADIWTAGTTLFYMLTGIKPYDAPHAADPFFSRLVCNLEMYLEDLQVYLSEEGYDLLHKLLHLDPSKRPSIDEIESHPWFASIDGDPKDELEDYLCGDDF